MLFRSVGEQRTELRRGGSFPVVLTVDELLAERRLDKLVLKLQARQFDADHGHQHGARQCEDDRHPEPASG